MGVKRALRASGRQSKAILVIPSENEDYHGIQGIGDGDDFLVNRDKIEIIESVGTEEAISRAKEFAKSSGILVGISSGANLVASERFILKNNAAGVVVTLLCDRGERYLSIF